MTMLGQAIAIAADAHRDHTCKAGVTYMLHPMKVMHDVRWKGEVVMCAAILHDVKEDVPDWEKYDWSVFDGTRVEIILDHLTRRESETYGEFIMRCAEDEDARDIKLADIKHNSDLRRMPLDRDITEKDLARANKYRIATIYLYRVKRGESPSSIANLN